MSVALVIFDCDGVLIDSEALCDRVVCHELAAEGWPLSPEECHHRFIGLTFPDIVLVAEAHIGRSLGKEWVDRVIRRTTETMAAEVETIPGARQAIEGITALGLPYRIASNSTREEMAAKFGRTGLAPLVEGRIHSAYDLIARGKRGKPDPDLFLEAAAAQGVAPAACMVIEDSLAGVTAAVAAGMTCLGYAPEGDTAGLRHAGAQLFDSMFMVPDLVHGFLHRR